MSDAEGLMWRLEADPTFASSFATVTLLDRPADMERLRRRMSRAVVLVPRLRQRVLDRPLGLAPVWADVAEVDLDHHVRNVTLPAPGTLRQLLDMATELLVQPFDRSGRSGSSWPSTGWWTGKARSSRRCTTPSPTARTASSCRCSSSTSSATAPSRRR